jgi:DNA-binding NarL/FixJ family response regulator
LREGGELVGLGLILLDRTVERERDLLMASLWEVIRTLSADRAGEEISDRVPQVGPVGPHALTRRELEVLHCLVAGLPARDIGAHLSVSYNTARNHVQNVLHKLEVHSKAQAVAYAVAHGLVDTYELSRLIGGSMGRAQLERSA